MSKKKLAVWESHEALEETMRRDTRVVAAALHLGKSLVGKWKEPVETDQAPDQSGARNPLDRLETIITTIEKINPERAYVPIKWLCARFGFLPPVKLPIGSITDDELMQAILGYNKEFGETSQKIAEILKDGRVSLLEFKELYKEGLEDVQALMALLVLMESRIS